MQYAKPHTSNTAPHHTLACSWNSTTGFAGGLITSHTPAPTIKIPFTNNEMPIKNQIEIPLLCMSSPNLHYQKMMLRTTNTMPTASAQNAGRSYHGTSASLGIAVAPYTRPTSSLSNLGLVR